jgi:hypothetical protein
MFVALWQGCRDFSTALAVQDRRPTPGNPGFLALAYNPVFF